MTAPIVYSSTDSGAPVLTGSPGGLISLLTTVLTTGYGSKPALGWTLEFSGTNKAVFRPGAGLRLYHRIDNSYVDLGYAYIVYNISTYETMTNVDTGAGGTALSYCYFVSDSQALTTVRPWMIIGDSKGFYLLVDGGYSSTATGYPRLFWMGEGIPLASSDAWCSFIAGGYTTSNPNPLAIIDNSSFASGGNTETCIRAHRNTAGSAIGPYTDLRLGGVCYNTLMGSNTLPAVMNYPFDGKLLYTQPFIHDTNINIARALLPGLYCPQHGAGLTDKQIYSDGTKSLLYLKITKLNLIGGVLIDIGEGFRP